MHYYYPVTMTEVRRALSERGDRDDGHLWWMCQEVGRLDPFSLGDAAKAGRWVGWILAQVEHLGCWTNAASRDLVRADVLHGKDRPMEAAL